MGSWTATRQAVVATVLSLSVVGAACSSVPTGSSPSASRPAADAVVERVVDGDTIVLTDGRTVRLIGVDTPESVDPRQPVECLGREAAEHTRSLLPAGTGIRVELDVEAHDRYGRTLAYVHRVDDDLFVNVALARDGFAEQLTIPPNVAHQAEIAAAVAEAREAGRGLWGEACGPTDTPSTPPVPSPTQDGPCDAAYPGTCLPPGPPAGPDIDCSDIAQRRFPVLPPDPHQLDGDGNGIGCESEAGGRMAQGPRG
jgi:micrococcal nuclease